MAIKAPGPVKYLICNADEGDPGAFMDRSVVEGNPHAVIEGMIIGAYAIGAPYGYVYIRAEYPLAVERLHLAIKQAKERRFLGKNIFGKGFDFDDQGKARRRRLRLRRRDGAHRVHRRKARPAAGQAAVPGPEGALGHSRRSSITSRPSRTFPTSCGKGAAWYCGHGHGEEQGDQGLRALPAKILNSGLIEVPMGIPLREVIYDIGGGIEGGKKLKAVQTGGPSGGVHSARA